MTPTPLTYAVWYGLAFLTALSLVLFVTPLTIRVAINFKIHDAPDGRLKKHTQPTPYLGGLAVASGFVIAFGLLSTPASAKDQAMGILAGGFMVLLLGLYDDLTNLKPGVKFLGQLLAAVVIWKAGVQVNIGGLPWWANMGLTLLWITGVTNAFNIIDIMDGLASGVAFIAAIFLFAIALLIEDAPVVPFMAITLAGALLGYLRFNFNPARIFLGDTGSLFVGFMIGSLSMLVSYTDHNRLALATPVVLLAVPIFDTAFVAWHRARKGIPFFRGSPDHFALRLRHAGLSVRQVVLRVYAVSVTLGGVALLIVFGPTEAVPWVLGAVGLLALLTAVLLSRLAPPPARAPAPATDERASGPPPASHGGSRSERRRAERASQSRDGDRTRSVTQGARS
ncbi:MAG: undecaprenyl/decaprenyl-phosphate alpha-N-acetylglucosaminyl 1-phosphate transferase [Planctomycetes bacterium]|nr:undecaprenyl/decaprenyl-phosphate alpha-N-acetylglucosaminyl 1-phosphate transferase [Planctomycetota bacterium]